MPSLPHDLKGPLARMALRIEMTDDESLKEGLRRDLHDMQQMVEQFLHFLRGQDADRLSCQPLQLDQWLSDRISESQALGEPVQWMGEKPALTVNADPVALGRLLSNLISNALEHGRAPVEVRLRALGAAEVEFSVSDHGPGIAASDRARAFEPFERLDAARTRTGNVGLGLSLAKGIAIAHGGRLELDQAASGGLSARVVLPRMV